jgi:glycosyltransferase involved in cell wall biosynthesis
MKIVHVVPALTKGGGEKVAAELANHAARDGHQVTLISGWPVDSSLLRDALDPEVGVLYVSKSKVSQIWRYFNLTSWLWRHRVWLVDQDILHCHLTYAMIFGILVRLWRSITGAEGPVIVQTNHSVGAPISRLRRGLFWRMAAQLDAQALIAEDEYWSSFALKHPKILTEVIFNGVAHPSCEFISSGERIAYRQKIGIPDNCNLVVGAVGRLTVDRKPWMYLPIFAEIAHEFGTDVHFVLAGGGSEFDRMRSLVIEYGLEEQIHFPGEVHEPSLPLAIMNLYISINVGAITGLAGMEAAMSRLPVLSMQWTPGYCAAPEDWIWSSTDLSEVAKRACELLHSPLSCEKLAQQQKAYVESNHTTNAMACSYYALYKNAIARFQTKTNDTN